jgi:RsiW-degrading membrane proteinase PrsW (M82 family)
MKTSAECQKELQASIMLFYYAMGASLSLLLVIMYSHCYNKHMEGVLAQSFLITGLVKILLALCLFAIFRALFQPTCPEQCSCVGELPGSVYSIIALTVGLLWLRRGVLRLRQAARLIAEEGGNADDDKEAVFKSVPIIDEVCVV